MENLEPVTQTRGVFAPFFMLSIIIKTEKSGKSGAHTSTLSELQYQQRTETLQAVSNGQKF